MRLALTLLKLFLLPEYKQERQYIALAFIALSFLAGYIHGRILINVIEGMPR